ncbi:MAG: hypothetical protein R2788_27005 [Saprospiraceae bacterium]
MNKLINRIGQNLQLHYLFFRCDTMTGDKSKRQGFGLEQKAKKIGGNLFEALFNQFNGLPDSN